MTRATICPKCSSARARLEAHGAGYCPQCFLAWRADEPPTSAELAAREARARAEIAAKLAADQLEAQRARCFRVCSSCSSSSACARFAAQPAQAQPAGADDCEAPQAPAQLELEADV